MSLRVRAGPALMAGLDDSDMSEGLKLAVGGHRGKTVLIRVRVSDCCRIWNRTERLTTLHKGL